MPGRTTLAFATLLMLLGAGCASPRGGVDRVHHVADAGIVGSWVDQSGRRLDVDNGPGRSYIVSVHRPGQDAERFSAYRLDVAGTKWVEVSVFDPRTTPTTADDDQPAIFSYYAVAHAGGQLSIAPLRDEWLRTHAADAPGVAYFDAEDADGPSGLGVAAGGREAVADLLRRASADPSAFAAPDVYFREF